MAGLFGNGSGGILGGAQTSPWQGILAAIQDAGAQFDGRANPNNFGRFQATDQENQIRQQLLQGLNSEDPAARQKAYAIAPMFGVDPSAFQKQRASQALPQLLTAMQPTQVSAPAAQGDAGEFGKINVPALPIGTSPGMGISDALSSVNNPELTAQYGPDLVKARMTADADAAKPFDLSPGQQRFVDGKMVASLPEKNNPNAAFNVDGTPNAAYQAYERQKMMAQQAPAWAGVAESRRYHDIEAGNQGKAPPGYRANPDGTLAYIPGGPADPTKGAGKKAPTEDQAKNTQLYQRASQQLPIALKHFDALSSPTNQIGASLPLIGGAATTSGDYQSGNNAVMDIAASYLYSVSGATANPGEVKNLAQTIVPKFGDKPAVVEEKRQRLSQMVESIRARAQPTASPQLGAPMAPANPAGSGTQGWGNFRVHP